MSQNAAVNKLLILITVCTLSQYSQYFLYIILPALPLQHIYHYVSLFMLIQQREFMDEHSEIYFFSCNQLSDKKTTALHLSLLIIASIDFRRSRTAQNFMSSLSLD